MVFYSESKGEKMSPSSPFQGKVLLYVCAHTYTYTHIYICMCI